MSILNLILAPLKYMARKANDKKYNKNQEQAKRQAYIQTGKEMKKSKYKINGSKRYKANLNKIKTKNKQEKDRNDKFIDDINI